MAQNQGSNPQKEKSASQQRGKDLREEMQESAEFGNDYRSSHQGADTISGQVNHGTPAPKDSNKK
ncbi:MAG: hypothetical protein ACAH59_10735 [Pseudobdellovibrionaceae bacterium]